MIVGTFYDIDREGRLSGYSHSADGFVPVQPGVNSPSVRSAEAHRLGAK